MAASQNTVLEIVEVTRRWAIDNGVDFAAVTRLLEKIAHVEGNESVSATTAKLYAAWKATLDDFESVPEQ